jgi:MazG family protein
MEFDMSNQARYPSAYEGLLQILERLRGPDGCPWDREQTRESLKSQLLEECYELIEAIEHGDAQELVEELGDVLLNVAFQVQIGQENGEFTSEQVFQALIEKLVRRHPHVFGDDPLLSPLARGTTGGLDARQVEANWEALRRKEKQGASILDGVPRQMPALAYAQSVQVRAARTGFDWDDFQGVLGKVVEELKELEDTESDAEREQELGDLLFSLVNAARWLGLDAEGALRQANSRFYRRFATMEKLSHERGLSFSDLPLAEKEALWQEAKRLDAEH